MLIEITYNVTDVFMSTTETPVYVEISFEQPGGTSAVWGSITGTLSNQTDLQNALNAKLDESTIDGGTEGQILSKASATDFDFAWINNYAKYLATNVRNQTGSTINAFQVVYISGATGNKPLISLADADTEATSSKTYGVTATAIANNGTGDVVTAGELSGINTSAFNEGDLLWLSTTAGGVVTSPPAEPAHSVFIGYVVRSHPTLGVIDVAIANGYELNELHGVQITSAANNDGLFYNSSNSLWENKTISTALGYTPVPTTRNITINGVTYDLSADRTWTISTGISGSGASGQVTYWAGASAVSGSNNLFWDAANGRLGIGTNVPAVKLDVNGQIIATGTSGKVGTIGANTYGISVQNNASASWIEILNNGGVGKGVFLGITNDRTVDAFELWNYQAGPIDFYTGGTASTGTIRARIGNNGNISIGTSSDLGVRLGVVGDTLLRGSGNTSATTALTVQNSDGTNMWRFRNDGSIRVAELSTAAIIFPFTTTYNTPDVVNGRNIQFFSQITSQSATNGSFYFAGSNYAQTSGAQIFTNISNGFAPTSGTAAFTLLNVSGTINQTGGANGVTRGLYVNPTLTAAADWRSIEWSNNTGWGLYGAGTANNYLAGSLGIGSTTLTGFNFRMGKNIEGALTSYGAAIVSTVQSGVTNGARVFYTEIGTQAASFTLSELSHYYSVQGSIGAGSSVLSQYGFRVHENLTGATNNYGFFGNIASGTGRWNLYMNGTADNYLAGNLGIGITPTVRLQVSGDTLLRGSGATSATTALTVRNSSSTDLFTVRNDGNVGIGTNTPSYKLDITNQVRIAGVSGSVGTIGGSTYALSLQNNATATWLEILNNGGINKGIFFGITTNAFELWNYQGGTIDFYTNTAASAGTKRLTIKTTGQLRFNPLTSAPSGAEAGDVYYDSTLNKLRVYTTAWETITSV